MTLSLDLDTVAAPAPVSDPVAFPSRAAMADDLPAMEILHDAAFGPGALTRSAYRVREGQPPSTPFCRVLLKEGTLVAAIRFTAVTIGDRGDALMLGPLAVAPAFANQGHGRRLIAEGLAAAGASGIAIVILVGDPPYYARFGFKRVLPGRILMPGPVDPHRLLAAELLTDAAALYAGRVAGAG